MISEVFTKTEATVHARRMMYKAVAQTVLFFGGKSWVFTGVVLKIL